MQVTELKAEGLSREYKVEVPAAAISEKVDAKIDEIKDDLKLPGFRPGKVPAAVVKQRFGQNLLGELFQQMVQEGIESAFEKNEVRPAMQPQLDFPEGFEGLKEGDDLEFTIAVEIMPDVPEVDFAEMELERETADVTDEAVDERLAKLAEMQTSYEDRDEGAAAEDGDSVNIDFLGKLDGEPFEGGAAEGFDLVLGSGQFIPGFEEQLIGKKVGDDVEVNVTFPEEYQAEHLAGKAVVFEVKVHAVKAPVQAEVNDELATKFGMENLDQLKERMKEQVANEYGQYSREKVKRALLDKLDDAFDFEIPAGLLDAEFGQIWGQFEQEMQQQEKTFDDMDKSEDEFKEEYKAIAVRRVRLGLALAEIGRKAEITVAQEELQRAVIEQAQRFPGQEQQVFEYLTQNQEAMANLRAPIMEEKVVDYILELAKVTDKTVSVDDLMKMDDEEHVHDENCDHDH